MEAHAATLALLAKDLADLDPARLQCAADHWAKTERFMPRAAELRALVAKFGDRKRAAELAVDRGNAQLAADGRDDVRWVVKNGHCVIEWVRPPSGSMVE